ncbi:Bud13 [Ascosphaera apis ARSEF 7405]|uniref:Bud13 n=1 Tax=Ascosphaera apis ARSEF 7405 TaxID=392613 RepID=A0A168AK36_9EURO|nr:Bud13 [Ascosphaera apis ARSEF 7405]
MSLADYLAKHYLTADKPNTSDTDRARPKKKKKKHHHKQPDPDHDGLIIADDDDDSLRKPASTSIDDPEFDPDDPSTYHLAASASGTGKISRERKTTKKNWKTISTTTTDSTDQAEADAILASAVAEREERARAVEDDQPVIEQTEQQDDETIAETKRMESGARAGLQTAEQTAALIESQRQQREAEEAAFRRKKKKSRRDGGGGGGDEPDPEQETIYRDASGRIINVAMKRAEARREAEEAAKRERAAKEAEAGIVQLREKERKREELREAKYMPVARGIDDEELNRELKAQMRWNDPAAEFLTKPTSTGGGGAAAAADIRGGKGGGVVKKMYKGAYPPNRYNIRPGYRWDGVDRGNGFEKQWFAARNKKSMRETLEYTWMMDD